MSYDANAEPVTVRAVPKRRSDAWIPIALMSLGVIPAIAGVVRLASFAPGGPSLSDGPRFAARPGVLAVHIVSGLTYSLLGALQLWPSLRRARPAMHRLTGRVLAPAGVVAGVSGFAVMLAYAPANAAGPLLHALRIVFGAAMIAFIGAGLAALARRDYRTHGAWMTRAYAIGVAPGTQALVLAPLAFLLHIDTEASFTVGMAAGWLVNLTVAEWTLRDRARAAARPRLADAARSSPPR